jgi:hypothetical protein
MLDELPGIGVWRLETKGFYATAILMGTLEMLQRGGHEHEIIKATLCLEQRTVKRVGKGKGKGTLKFAVPVLWPHTTPRTLLAGAVQGLLTPAAAPQPPALEAAIADLYGDPVPWTQTTEGLAQMHTLEREIRANGGTVNAWYDWAEKRFKKPRAAFTVAEVEQLHEAVQAAAALRRGEIQTVTPEAGVSREPGDEDPDTGDVQEPELPLA